jgi:DNA repair protein RecO (recombination protein O)
LKASFYRNQLANAKIVYNKHIAETPSLQFVMPSADALILRTVDFSETSRIVTLYTRQYGKIEALAKGGRRLKGPFESSLDILARNSIVFIAKKGDVLDLLTESKLIRRFHVCSSNLSGTLGGYYVAELINSFTAASDPMPALYDLAVKVLQQLEEGTFVMRTLIRFEGRLLQLIGQAPSLWNCVGCGKPVSDIRIVFGTTDGGVLCPDCSPSHRQTIAVTAETLDTWEALVNPLDRSETWKHLPISRQTLGEIRNLANQYICCLLGWKPKLHDWWSVIAKNER